METRYFIRLNAGSQVLWRGEEREARETTSAKSEIQGSVASGDQATQEWLTEAEQVAGQQKAAADRLTKHRTMLDSLRKSLNGKRSKQADKDAAAVTQLEAAMGVAQAAMDNHTQDAPRLTSWWQWQTSWWHPSLETSPRRWT